MNFATLAETGDLFSLGVWEITKDGKVKEYNRIAHQVVPGEKWKTLQEIKEYLGLESIIPARIYQLHPRENLYLKAVYLSSEASDYLIIENLTKEAEKDFRLYCLENIIERLPVGVLAARGTDGTIFIYNQQISKFEGLDPSDVLDKHITEVYDTTPEKSEHLSVLHTNTPLIELYQKYFTHKGNEINLVASTYPICKNGEVVASVSVARNITKMREMLSKTVQLQEQLREKGLKNGTSYDLSDFIGKSSATERVKEESRRAAGASCNVLLCGETGTGKEIIAQGIHNSSSNRWEPFVAVNCAAIPDNLLESMLFGTVKGAFTGAENKTGLIEHAGEGTLFLDEVNSINLSLQSKLLRVLQEKKYRKLGDTREQTVKCRFTSSVGEDPWVCIEKGTLRKDLYFRLAVMTIYIPPLRERADDVVPLAEFYLAKYRRIYGHEIKSLSENLMEMFLSYNWQGNVRELAHVIESAINMAEEGQELLPEHLPAYLRSKFEKFARNHQPTSGYKRQVEGSNLPEILKNTEKEIIEETLKRNQGNISRSARELGIARQNLQYRIRKLSIELPGGLSP